MTLTILLTAISFAMKQRNLKEDAAGTKKFLIATDVKNDTHVIVSHEKHLSLERLIRRVDELECAEASRLSVNSFVGSCCVSKSKDKQIVDAFKFFSGRIGPLPNEELIAFRNALIETSYVKIESSSEEDSYTIFEILNARGLELEDHELLKNYVMRYINPAEKRDDAKAIWADIENLLGSNIKPFLRHYAIQKYRLVKGDKEGPYKKFEISPIRRRHRSCFTTCRKRRVITARYSIRQQAMRTLRFSCSSRRRMSRFLGLCS